MGVVFLSLWSLILSQFNRLLSWISCCIYIFSKSWKSNFEHFEGKFAVLTAIISKAMIKFLSKFHVQIHWYRFTRGNRLLLNPFQSSRKTFPPAPLSTSTIVLVCVFSTILNSIIEGRKYRASELLKAILSPKKQNKNAEKLCRRFSSTSNTNVQRCLYALLQN